MSFPRWRGFIVTALWLLVPFGCQAIYRRLGWLGDGYWVASTAEHRLVDGAWLLPAIIATVLWLRWRAVARRAGARPAA